MEFYTNKRFTDIEEAIFEAELLQLATNHFEINVICIIW